MHCFYTIYIITIYILYYFLNFCNFFFYIFESQPSISLTPLMEIFLLINVSDQRMGGSAKTLTEYHPCNETRLYKI